MTAETFLQKGSALGSSSPSAFPMPRVSVVIPTYNRGSFVGRAIRSVLGQTFEDFELIVVDDGSTDGTAEALSGFEGRIRTVFQQNRGVSAARNAGVAASAGDLLAFLDSDDEWLPRKLERQLEFLGQSAALGMCHTDEIWLRNGKPLAQKSFHRKQGGRFFERALERCLISPSSVMITRALLDEVGPFDESLPAAEDYDLWLRVTAFHEVGFVPEPLIVKHGGHEDQLSCSTPVIDAFRIRAILKILDDPRLPRNYREAARAQLAKKCRIVAGGLLKRGRGSEAEEYLELAARHENPHAESR